MKTLLFIFMMVLTIFAQGVKSYDAEIMFGSAHEYQIIDGGKYLVSAGTRDTLNGILIPNGGGADITLTGNIINNSGTINFLIEVGLDMGDEYGIDWHEVGTFSSADRFVFNFLDQNWGTKQVCGRFLIRIIELADQSNSYGLRAHIFKWKD
jgi:hypothetical protein